MATPRPFGERMREARAARGMTQEEAAKALGTHRVTVAKWETGANTPKGIALKVAEAWIARTKKGGRRGA